MDLDLCRRLANLGEPSVAPPRLLVVLAHPDDEVLALGGRLEWLSSSVFVCVTDGVPLDGADARAHGFTSLADYGNARRSELTDALRLSGLDPASARNLALGPGQTVTSDQRAAFSLADIARATADLLQHLRPDAVLTHPYEGGHPDHDACAFAVSSAVRLSGLSLPILEAPFYHAGPHRIATEVFLSGDAGQASLLTEQQAANKRIRLACFRSQAETLGLFPLTSERFRPAPSYNFAVRPHAGRLFYEQFPWGMDGDRFCDLATSATAELGG